MITVVHCHHQKYLGRTVEKAFLVSNTMALSFGKQARRGTTCTMSHVRYAWTLGSFEGTTVGPEVRDIDSEGKLAILLPRVNS